MFPLIVHIILLRDLLQHEQSALDHGFLLKSCVLAVTGSLFDSALVVCIQTKLNSRALLKASVAPNCLHCPNC